MLLPGEVKNVVIESPVLMVINLLRIFRLSKDFELNNAKIFNLALK